MAAPAATDPIERRYGLTHRVDRWWVEPLLVGSGLGIFIIYSGISAMLGDRWAFETENGLYLSPFFEPLIHPGWLPDWFSPALLILWAPLGFRTTCYYYRRAYYRSYFLSPPACAVREPANSYAGESTLPLVIQNAHRWFMYVALLFIPILFTGAIKSYHLPGEGLGVGLGSIILTLNAFFLMMYTIGCHSLRHWVAGGLNQFSRTPLRRVRRQAWEVFTVANEHHRLWAWVSLVGVGVTDLYVHLVANGVITDPNTFTGPI
ncbi:MAG: succinate dehydrogenase [Dehalococcoidia bacterium]|nr:succinate dehydrogenase [Dehalococcoidia bacterium]